MLKLCFCIGRDNELIDEVNPKEVHVQVFADHEVAIGCLVLLFGGESIDSVKAQIIVASPFDSMGVILSLVLLERLKGEAHDEVGDLVSAYLNLDLVTVVVMGSQTLEKLFIEHLRVNKWTSQSCKSFQGPELGMHLDPLGKILQRSGGEWGCWLEFIAGGSQGGKTIHLWCCSTARCWPDERSKSRVRVQTSCSRCTSCKGEDCRIGSVRIDPLFLSLALVGSIRLSLVASFVEVLLDSIDDGVLPIGVVFVDGQNLGFGIRAQWTIYVQNDSLMISGSFGAISHHCWLLLQDLGSQVRREEVDEEGHADLINDVLVGRL